VPTSNVVGPIFTAGFEEDGDDCPVLEPVLVVLLADEVLLLLKVLVFDALEVVLVMPVTLTTTPDAVALPLF